MTEHVEIVVSKVRKKEIKVNEWALLYLMVFSLNNKN